MNTRSVACSSENSLSTSANGGSGNDPSAFIFTRRGPNVPRCNHNDADPGPPLKLNITGRGLVSGFSTRV